MNQLRELAGAPPLPLPPARSQPPLSELDRAVDILVEMKDLAEAAVGLAYSALLFNNRSLAAEVGTLEARPDILHDELESWVLRAAPEARDPDELRGLLRLGAASRVDLRCRSRHDLVRGARRSRSTRSCRWRWRRPRRRAPRRSCSEARTRRDARSRSSAGDRDRHVRARGPTWVPLDLPSAPQFAFQEGDRVISVGPEEGEEELAALTRAPVPAHG